MSIAANEAVDGRSAMETVQQIQKKIEETKSQAELRKLYRDLGEAFATVRRGGR
jgi:hypothetical protein